MTALDLVTKYYQSSMAISDDTTGFSLVCRELDCNCVDCGDDSDCSTPW